MVPRSAFAPQETEGGASPSQAAPASLRSWGAREVGGMRAPAQGRVLDHVVSRTWSTDADLTARQRHKQKVWNTGGSKQGAGVLRRGAGSARSSCALSSGALHGRRGSSLQCCAWPSLPSA